MSFEGVPGGRERRCKMPLQRPIFWLVPQGGPLMFSDEQDGVGAKRTSCSGGRETRLRRSIFARHALQRPGVLAASLTTGFLIGIAYRYFVYDPTPGNLANYARSGIHGAGLALTARVVQTAFASNARSSLGLALRRLPLWGELLVRALVMTAALIVVGVSLQLVTLRGAARAARVHLWLVHLNPAADRGDRLCHIARASERSPRSAG